MKGDFVNFILNITGQAEIANIQSYSHHGFCAIDLQPIFDDSVDAVAHRDAWNEAQFVKSNIGSQKTIRIVNLAEFVALPSEIANPTPGGGAGPFDHPVIVTWFLAVDFTSIQNLDAFKTQLAQDFADALGIPASRIIIKVVKAASTDLHVMAGNNRLSVEFEITPTTDPTQPTAVALSVELDRQFHEPNSDIYSGVYTSQTDKNTIPNTHIDLTNSAFSVGPSFFFLVAALFALRY